MVIVAAGERVAAAVASAASWPPQELSRQGREKHDSSSRLRDRDGIIGCSVKGEGELDETCMRVACRWSPFARRTLNYLLHGIWMRQPDSAGHVSVSALQKMQRQYRQAMVVMRPVRQR